MAGDFSKLPIIDVGPLVTRAGDRLGVTAQIARACRESGFFYIVGHSVSERLQERLEDMSRKFFAQGLAAKLDIRMENGGRAWRGYFLEGIALSLGLNESYFAERYTSDPLILFRIFNYPPDTTRIPENQSWGVGEHTDYGLLTILKQDRTGGLEVRSKSGWVEARPIPLSFVCNIGDMLDRMTGGLYRSTAHRVKSPPEHDRLSFPFFFDPADVNSEIKPIEVTAPLDDDRNERWDRASVHDFSVLMVITC